MEIWAEQWFIIAGLNLAPLTKLRANEFDEKVLKGPEQVLSEQIDNWEKTRKKLERCFGKVCFEKMKKYCSSELLPDETLAVFFEALEKVNIDNFQRELGSILIHKTKTGMESSSLFLPLLARTSAGDSVSVFLDVKNYNKYPVASEATMND